MKIFFTLLLLSIFLISSKAQKTLVRIENPQEKELSFYDYLTYDSIYATNKKTDYFLVDNDSLFRTLTVLDAEIKSKFNILILDKDTLSINFEKYLILSFKEKTINNAYQIFTKSLDSLKQLNASDFQKNNLVYQFMINHTDLYSSLEYAHNAFLYNLHSKDSCIALFKKLNPKLKRYDLWQQTEMLAKGFKLLKEGDSFPTYRLQDISFKEIKLLPFKRKTILIFWASWCKPCIKELEIVKKKIPALASYKIVLINVDINEEIWKNSLRKLHLENFENYRALNQLDSKIALELSVKGIPHSTIISEENIIKHQKLNIFYKKELNHKIYYNSNVDSLTKEDKRDFLKIIDTIPIKNIQEIRIVGFANEIGNQESNLILSEKRAKNIQKFLLRINKTLANRIKIKAKGEIGKNTASQLVENRKVEVVFDYIQVNKNLSEFQSLEVGSKMILKNILFEGNKAVVLPSSYAEVKRLTKYMLNNPKISIEIQGHICCLSKNWKGNYAYELSEKRAKFIHDYLIKNGVLAKRLSYKGLGLEFPLNGNRDDIKNRRVEILRTK